MRLQEDVEDVVVEICGLIKLPTDSPAGFIRRLATLPSNLHETHRRTLLKAAKTAVELAYIEFDITRSACRQRMPENRVSTWISRIPFADVRDFKECIYEVIDLAERLKDSTIGFGFFEVVEPVCRRATESVRISFGRIVPEIGKAEMVEIRWAVERECMYWAAVTMIRARIG